MSQKVQELVRKARDLLSDGRRSITQCVHELQNEIDSKEGQIRDIFAENIDSILQKYMKYQETTYHQKRLQTDCEQFSKQIEKTKKLSQYDESLLERTEKTLQNLLRVKETIEAYRDHVRRAKKIIINIKQEKLNNAIKSLKEYSKHEPENKVDTPLKKVLPLLTQRIQEHFVKLITNFWVSNQQKIEDIGKKCFNKVYSSFQQKINIYQTFFGSSAFRGASNLRGTTLQRNVEPDFKFLMKKSEESNEMLNKFILRINVEMSSLKQARVMTVELQGPAKFNQIMKQQMKRYLNIIAQHNVCQKSSQFRNLLSIFIGYLLIRRQIIAFFDLKGDQKLFISDMYRIICKQCKSVIDNVKSTKQIVASKQLFQVFFQALQIIKIGDSQEQYCIVISQILKSYFSYSLMACEKQCLKCMEQDNLCQFKAKNQEQLLLIEEVLNIPANSNAQYNFTSFVMEVMQLISDYCTEVTTIVHETDIEKSVIHNHLSDLIEKIIALYGGALLIKQQAFQLIQGQANLSQISKIFQHYREKFETANGFFSVTSQRHTEQTMQRLIVKLTRNLMELIKQKIMAMMQNYPKTVTQQANNSHNQFVEWVFEFILHIITYMKEVNCPNHDGILIETMRELCQQYWQHLQQLKEFNLLVIYNLDLDLSFIYRYCTKNFANCPNLLQRFRSLREFYALMLTNNIQDIAQPTRKAISYGSLDIDLVISMLKKYVMVKTSSDKIRELKKKDVDALIKKLQGNAK